MWTGGFVFISREVVEEGKGGYAWWEDVEEGGGAEERGDTEDGEEGCVGCCEGCDVGEGGEEGEGEEEARELRVGCEVVGLEGLDEGLLFYWGV